MAASQPSNRELLAQVRAWVEANYPGCPLEYITIHCRYLVVPIQLAEGPVAAATPAMLPASEEEGESLSPIVLDILEVLREARRPLSRTRILEELERKGRHYNPRTVAGYLAGLVNDGTLENPGPGRGGYRLPQEDLGLPQ